MLRMLIQKPLDAEKEPGSAYIYHPSTSSYAIIHKACPTSKKCGNVHIIPALAAKVIFICYVYVRLFHFV